MLIDSSLDLDKDLDAVMFTRLFKTRFCILHHGRVACVFFFFVVLQSGFSFKFGSTCASFVHAKVYREGKWSLRHLAY